MTRSELVAALAQRFPGLVLKDADVSVKEIRGFGSFSLNYRPPRLGRNPKTGEKVAVEGKYVPHFKAGKELRERLLDQ